LSLPGWLKRANGGGAGLNSLYQNPIGFSHLDAYVIVEGVLMIDSHPIAMTGDRVLSNSLPLGFSGFVMINVVWIT